MAAALVLALLAAALQGCGTSSQSATRHMSISFAADNMFTVAGTKVPLAKLPAKLKSAGAAGNTEILISVGDDTPQATLNAIAGKLRAEGFGRIMFTKPRRAVSTVSGSPGALAPSGPPPAAQKALPPGKRN